MEDYQGAFRERAIDTECLHNGIRKSSAMHIGGITVECLLKSMIVDYFQILEWKTDFNNPDHTISNPQHQLLAAIKRIPRLLNRIQSNPQLMKMIDTLQQPQGDFISIRYKGVGPSTESYDEWYNSYKRMVQWLLKQSTKL